MISLKKYSVSRDMDAGMQHWTFSMEIVKIFVRFFQLPMAVSIRKLIVLFPVHYYSHHDIKSSYIKTSNQPLIGLCQSPRRKYGKPPASHL